MYNIKFYYDRYLSKGGSKRVKSLRETEVVIRRGDVEVARATVRQNYNDPDIKREARRYALLKATENLPRDVRQEIFNNYTELVNGNV